GQPEVKGKWDAPFDLHNVGIHVHVLPDGKVLFWSRREKNQGLDEQDCVPRVWNPATGKVDQLPGPLTNDPNPGKYNLFCSGHTFLPDGRLLAVGGHHADSKGLPHASLFDPAAGKWAATDKMNAGRWYPSAVTLADGGVLVSGGSDEHGTMNIVQQVWKDGKW